MTDMVSVGQKSDVSVDRQLRSQWNVASWRCQWLHLPRQGVRNEKKSSKLFATRIYVWIISKFCPWLAVWYWARNLNLFLIQSCDFIEFTKIHEKYAWDFLNYLYVKSLPQLASLSVWSFKCYLMKFKNEKQVDVKKVWGAVQSIPKSQQVTASLLHILIT